MHLDPYNFLTFVKDVVTGSTPASGGFLRDLVIPLSAGDWATTRVVDTSDAGAAADPVIEGGAHLEASETNGRVVKVEEATDTIGFLSIVVPRDYDEALDHLTVRVLANQITVSTDNDVELDVELYVKNAGAALSADKNPTKPGTVLTTAAQWITFNLSGFGLKRLDVVHLKLITNGANDTDGEEIVLGGIQAEYRSCLVSYNRTAGSEDLR